jgi:AcrR family transcriptional regulator
MPRSKQQFEEIRNKSRKQILDAALKLFAVKGFDKTSVSDIAREAGVSKGLAYNYFESKQKLAEAIFEMTIELGKEMEAVVDSVEDPYEKLAVFIDLSGKFIRENETLWRFLVNFSLQPKVTPGIIEYASDYNNHMLYKVEEIFRTIGIENARHETYIYSALFDGIGLNYYLLNKSFPFDAVMDLFKEKYSRKGLQHLIKKQTDNRDQMRP